MMSPEEGAHYIAGRVPHQAQGRERFEILRSPEGLPQITLDANGFKSMEDSHIYKLWDDLRKGFLVRSRQPRDLDGPAIVEFTEEQRREIQSVIAEGKFI